MGPPNPTSPVRVGSSSTARSDQVITSPVDESPHNNTLPSTNSNCTNQDCVVLKLKVSDFSDTPYLPPYKEHSVNSTVDYNGMKLSDFSETISEIYEHVIYWDRNMFSVPSGAGSKRMIELLGFWLDQ